MAFFPFDLYTLFVENVFGGFWLAIVGLAVIIFIIMAAFGRMSAFSSIIYLMLFVLAMALGYGAAWIFVLLLLVVIIYFITQVYSFVGRQATY